MDQSESQQVFSNLLSPPNIQTQRDTQCGTVVPRLLDLSGPFQTKHGSAVIVPCSIQGAGETAETLAAAAALQQLAQTLLHPPWVWRRRQKFPELEVRREGRQFFWTRLLR